MNLVGSLNLPTSDAPESVEPLRMMLVGPPGSGKGTQAGLLSKRLGLAHIATGDILRGAVARGTPAGLQAGPLMENGKLVPDDLVNEIVADVFRCEERPERFILDGYPRTLAQASSFDQVLRQQFLDLTTVIFLVVPDETIVRRLGGRRVCRQCSATYHTEDRPPKKPGVCDECGGALALRPDDDEATVRKRLELYHQNTEELIPFYASKGIVREVYGVGDIETIYLQIVKALNQAGPTC